jgi:hypothetical protein|tara:strand:- start:51 stop:1016 length:966 start_codon:yes stop_codon:yes gene_type:complete
MAGYIGANTSSVNNNQNAAERRKKFTFTANTTVLSGLNFAPEKIHIFHNGIRLVRTTDYTEAADGRSVTLVNAAQAGDEVVAITFAQDPASGAYTDADVDAHLLDAGVTLDATNDRIGVGIAAPTAPIHIEAPDNTELMNFTVTGNEKWALKGASGVGSDDYVSFGISGGTEAIRWHETGYVRMPQTPMFSYLGSRTHTMGTGDMVWSSANVWSSSVNHSMNNGSHFNPANGRFTAPITGLYHFQIQAQVYGHSSGYFYTYLDYNGSVRSYIQISQGNVYYLSTHHIYIELNANDYVNASSTNNYTGSQILYPAFSGALVG